MTPSPTCPARADRPLRTASSPLLRPPRVTALALAVAAALTLGGCAGPARAPAAVLGTELPAAWSQAPADDAATHAPLPPQWWQSLGDATLNALMQQALAHNTDLAAARAALAQAEALRDAREAALSPSLSLSASAQRSKSGGAPAGNAFATTLGAGFTPGLFGGNQAALNAAQADARAAWASLAGTRLTLTANLALAYIDLRSQQQRLDIAERNLQAQESTRSLTAWRVQAGLASSLDLEQATQAVEQTAAAVAALRTAIGQDMHALAVLSGQPPAALRETLRFPAPLPEAAPPVLAAPADVLRQRPDVRAAEARVQAALARLDQAAAARWPSVSLSASLGLRSLTLGGLLDGSVANALLASLAVPLFDGGALAAQQRAQAAAVEQSRAQWTGTVLAALKEVENALLALRQDAERLQHLQAAAAAARNAELMAQARFRSGVIDFRTVLDAQRATLSTQDAVAVQRATLLADQVRLMQALGGGWTPDASAAEAGPAPPPVPSASS